MHLRFGEISFVTLHVGPKLSETKRVHKTTFLPWPHCMEDSYSEEEITSVIYDVLPQFRVRTVCWRQDGLWRKTGHLGPGDQSCTYKLMTGHNPTRALVAAM